MSNANAKEISPTDPASILREAAAAFKKQWPGMSLRAVAGRLEISPSYWSKILRGEKPLPQTLIPKVVRALGMDDQQIALLQRSILNKIENDYLAPATGFKVAREAEESPIKDYRNLGRDDFWLLEEWFYIPILNLLTLTNYDATFESIADRLGIRVVQVKEAIRRCEQRGLLIITPEGKFKRTEMQARFPTDRSFTHVRTYHQTMLQKMKEELAREGTAESFAERLVIGVCFTGASEKMREARLILEEAMYRAANLMADEPEADEIYQVNIQLIPLSRPHARKKSNVTRIKGQK